MRLQQDVRGQLLAPTVPTDAALVDTAVLLMLQALPKQQQLALVQLSVFPSGFDSDGAAAVMEVEPYRAQGVIQVS